MEKAHLEYETPEYSLDECEKKLQNFNPVKPHDKYMVIAIEEAIQAGREGNFAVGGCLVENKSGEVIIREHNHVFHPYTRSDLHSEMTIMTKFEDQVKGNYNPKDYTLFSSLEPCPMCLTRLITAGIGEVYHAAPDLESGMVHRLDKLSPLWVELAESQTFAEADCSDELKALAEQVWLYSANKQTDVLFEK